MELEALTRIGHLYHIEQPGKALSIDARQWWRLRESLGLYLETLAIPDPL
jgi:hypothetical protein